MIRGTWKDESGNWWTQEDVMAFDQEGNGHRQELPPRPATEREIEFAIELSSPSAQSYSSL